MECVFFSLSLSRNKTPQSGFQTLLACANILATMSSCEIEYSLDLSLTTVCAECPFFSGLFLR